jgi:hypothetical protein
MPIKRLRTSLKRDEGLRASRVLVGKSRLVYVLIADKRLKYGSKKSRIAYIGTTRKGMSRIAQSIATRADAILGLRGVYTFHARIVTCGRRQKVRTWHKLERALLLLFKERFGVIPVCNSHGKRMKETDEFRYFRRTGISNLIDELT